MTKKNRDMKLIGSVLITSSSPPSCANAFLRYDEIKVTNLHIHHVIAFMIEYLSSWAQIIIIQRLKWVKTEWVQVWANSIHFVIYAVNSKETYQTSKIIMTMMW